jgi:hypothetical protein
VPKGVPFFSHSSADEAVPGAVQLGKHLTAPTTTLIMDSDLTTNAAGPPNFVTCVACHNPHGSTLTQIKATGPAAKNIMIIEEWQKNALCDRCHL